jgi:SEC-C motif-containing protein
LSLWARKYAECCQPTFGQAKAQTAAQLMRSRYSAFAKHEIDYIVKTSHRAATILDVAIADWSQSNQWLKLEVFKPMKNR